MSTKRVSYMKVLKEAIAKEWDTTKTIDTKGPMLEPILSYDGGGELPTNRDAASILERYYFKDKDEELVEHVDNEVAEVPEDNIPATKKDIEKEIDDGEKGSATFKEGDEVAEGEEVTEAEEKEEEEDEEEEKEEVKEDLELTEEEAIENAVLEKLIAEMEEEVSEDAEVTTEEEAPAEEEEAEAEETEESVKVAEQEEEEEPELEKELDVDKEMPDKEEEVKEASGEGAPPGFKGAHKGAKEDDIEEAFNLFREEIEEEDVDVIDSDDVRV